ncbi:FtsX-like permease family protein [Dysgonomonas sp. Marseille-P4677]|nr:FtsX-like permease family protein [Dysgonomonas sp. Marseille-P4677]
MTVAQTSIRANEIATRKLLGADNKSIILQGLLESIVMIFITSILGFAIALLLRPYFENVLNSQIHLETYLSVQYIVIGLSSLILIGIIAGIIPALMTSKFQPIEILKGRYKRKLKSIYSKIFTSFQYTVSIVLIIVGFFILLQFNFLIKNNIGVDKNRTLIISQPCSASQKAALKNEIMKIPDVEAASFTAGNPIDGGNNNTEEINGESVGFQIFTVDSSFYQIFDIDITPTGMHQLGGVIMNEQSMNILNVDTTNYIAKFGNNEYPVTGVAKDFHFRPLTKPIGPAFIQPMTDDRYPWSLLVKISPNADLFETAKQIKETHTKFIGHSLQEIKFIDETINQWYEKESRLSQLITIFSVFSIVITVMGIFAMALYQVEQRKKEIAIRKINGATVIQVLNILNYDSVKYVTLAFIIGAPISYYIVNRWLENFAYRISITPIVFLVALLIVLSLTLISVSIMTWQAANANPVKSLSSE